MSSRPFLAPFPVFTSVTGQSMATSLTSLPTVITNVSIISYDISWTGTAVGTFSVQVSNTYSQNAAGGNGGTAVAGNWTTLTLSGTAAATTGGGNGAIEIDVTGFHAIRLVYTAISGTGTLNATISGKAA